MIESFNAYLTDIGITSQPFLERIEFILKGAKRICNDEIIDIFISNYIKKDFNIEYLGLGIYFKKFIITASEFLYVENFMINPSKIDVDYIIYNATDYNFEEANERSKLQVIVYSNGNPIIEGKGLSKNCDYLKKIVEKYYFPNLLL